MTGTDAAYSFIFAFESGTPERKPGRFLTTVSIVTVEAKASGSREIGLS